ncbi:hypothetical protein FSP39_012758 [Pinctada imbricata]|uniref:Uncharacterized protein n=1 Tax=Pinctada imbricata TaxID=66713 RepID=A0AA89BJD2_PINIB|nr:hypothetical protein FSP39_012758 [Pinctada imbricata]
MTTVWGELKMERSECGANKHGAKQQWGETSVIHIDQSEAFLGVFAGKVESSDYIESTPEGRRVTKLDQILLNGNNITMVTNTFYIFVKWGKGLKCVKICDFSNFCDCLEA